ncbi:MAG: TonB-dependent receptor, partial [Prevotella sp.]|nr:TonB-dependent receptor [Prevotella sp.]
DMVFNNADLMTNNAILAMDYNGRSIDTGTWPSANIIFSPRVGFTWDVLGDKSLKFRGGTGLFAGNLPLVFFTNMPTNSGMVQYQAQINAASATKNGFSMDTFKGGLVTDANGNATIAALYNKLVSLGYPETINPEDGTAPSSISAVDPKFKMPQVWKTSLAIDYAIPVSFPMTVSVEGILNKTLNAASISDWSVPSVGGFTRLNGVDNRPIYPAGYHQGTKAFMLENTSRGYGWTFNAEVNARPTEFLSLMAAYTHTVNKEVTGMPGSNAESAFTYVPTVQGPNNIRLHNSQYVTPDRFIASATAHDRSGNHYSLIYETWRGNYSYSFMTANDMNADGYNYDALYIPTDQQVNDNQFRFVSEGDKTRFMDYVHANGYLSKNQGKYAEPYSLYSPWVHRVDFSYKHDFSINVGQSKHALQLSLDVKNLLNLFNSSWGVAKYLNPEIGTDPRVLKYEGYDADGYATFSTPASINGNTKTFVPNHSLGQCWYAQIGIKYMFN